MILISSSLERPVFTSVSMPRSLKMATAAGDNLSEIRTLGMNFLQFFPPPLSPPPALGEGDKSSISPPPTRGGRSVLALRVGGSYCFTCAKAQSSQGVSASISDV